MPTTVTLPTNIFNLKKTDYEQPSIFLGQQPGLMDTINKIYPKLWSRYKTLRSLDWDENEFDYSPCNAEFKHCDRSVYDMMIKTLAYQWEADSVAARSIVAILGPVCTSTEAWAGYSRIGENEVLHGNTYSEIVRNSFDDPSEILDEILKVEEAHARLVAISNVFNKAHDTSHKYALGLVENNQETYNDIYMFIVALLCLERIQFMCSFAITFAIAETGQFMPIAKAVQKIAQDEFEIHVQFGMDVLRYEMQTERGRTAFEQCKSQIVELINEVVTAEDEWIDYAFSEGRELTGVSKEKMLAFNHFNGSAVAKFFEIGDQVAFPIVDELPLPYMRDWINISSVQSSPQEEENNQYKVGVVAKTDDGATDDFEMEF